MPGPGLDEPITVYGGSGLSADWYASDQEGSIIATADASANLIAAYDYGPYGEPLTSGGAPSWGGARYRYTGQIEIPGAQTYFYKARMYDPGNGRFFQTDPAGFGSGINIYAYAVNDPINGWDPWGMFIGTDIIDLGGGCTATTDYWDTVSYGDDGTTVVTGYKSTSISCAPTAGGNGVPGGGGNGAGPQPPAQPQNTKKPCLGSGDYAFSNAVDATGAVHGAVFNATGAMLKLSGQAADATMLGAAATPAGIILTVLSEGFGAVQDYSRGMRLGRTAAIHGAGAAVGIAASIDGAEFGFAVGEALFPAGGGIVGTVIGGVIGAYGGDKAGQFAGAAGASAAGFCR